MKNSLTRRSFLAVSAASLVPAAGASVLGSSRSLLSMVGGNGSTRPTEDWKKAGVTDLDRSPHARLRTVPVSAVTIRDGFWRSAADQRRLEHSQHAR